MGFTVRLDEVFSGPLDLLLHLVTRQEVEISTVSVADVCDAYLAHLEALEELDVEAAGDYLVCASSLVLLKSRSLLPVDETAGQDDDLDPGMDLVRHLMAYRRFREAADAMGGQARERARRFAVRVGREEQTSEDPEINLDEVTAWDLADLWERLKRETSVIPIHRVEHDPRPIRRFMREIVDRLRGRDRLTFSDCLSGEAGRAPRAATFAALLELVKGGVIEVAQKTTFGAIDISLKSTDEKMIERSLAAEELEDS